jgi:hypothetical protein
MADDRSGKQHDEKDQSSGKRVVGRGMTSPDSTEAVLDATTGEPDPRARGDAQSSDRARDRDSSDQ